VIGGFPRQDITWRRGVHRVRMSSNSHVQVFAPKFRKTINDAAGITRS